MKYIRINKGPQDSRKRFIAIVTGFLLLLLIRDVAQIGISNWMFIAYAAMAYVAFTYEECVAFSLMFIALGTGTPVNYILGVGVLVMLYKKKEGIFNPRWIPMLALITWEFCHGFIQPFSVPDFVRYAVCMIAVILIGSDEKTEIDSVFVLKCFLASTLFVCADIFIQTFRAVGYNWTYFVNAGFRYGDMSLFQNAASTAVQTSTNQNTVGEFCVISISILLIFFSNKIGNRKYTITLMLVYAVFGFLTMSKTFFLSLILLIALYIFSMYRDISWKKALGRTFGFICIVLLFLVFMQNVLPNTVSAVLNRFTGEDRFSERDVLFERYTEILAENPRILLFGIGNQNKSAKTGIHSPHNSIQEALVNWGIVGAALLIWIIANTVQVGKKRASVDRLPLLYYLPLITLLFFSQAGQLFGMNEKMLYFAVFVFVYQTYKKGEKVRCAESAASVEKQGSPGLSSSE